MVRWEPGAAQRLQAAALELYVSKGFEETTAAEIASSVGLSERTFFRHFADKREVLFSGQEILHQGFVEGIAAAPQEASPLQLVAAALAAAAELFPNDRRSYSRLRQLVITAHPALQERELLKLAQLTRVVATAVRDRGVSEPAATLAAESCVSVFKISFEEWVGESESRPFLEIEQAVIRELEELATLRPASP